MGAQACGVAVGAGCNVGELELQLRAYLEQLSLPPARTEAAGSEQACPVTCRISVPSTQYATACTQTWTVGWACSRTLQESSQGLTAALEHAREP